MPELSASREVTLPGALDERRLLSLNRLTLSGACLPSLAHDLNNPLHVVLASLEMLMSEPDLPAALTPKLERVFAAATRVSSTLTGVVGFLRDTSDARTNVDANGLLERAVALRRHAIRRARLELSVEPSPVPLIIHVSPAEIIRALLTLLLDAEAALDQQPGARLTLQASAHGDRCRFTVADTGPELREISLATPVDPFDSARPTDPCGALGLAAAAVLVKRNGGRLLLAREGVRNSAILELPLRQ